MAQNAESTPQETTITPADLGGEPVQTPNDWDEGIEAALKMFSGEEEGATPTPSGAPTAATTPKTEGAAAKTAPKKEGAAAPEGGATPPPEETPEVTPEGAGATEQAPTEGEATEPPPEDEGAAAGKSDTSAQEIGKAIVEAIRGAQPAKEAPPEATLADEEDVQVTPEDFMSADEKEYLKQYDTEWGDVSRAERIRTRAAVEHATHELKQEVVRVLAPIVQRLNSLQVNQQLSVIRSAHPDYDTVIKDIPAWIETQPELYRGALADVLRRGDEQQIVQLLTTYKQATGTTSTAPVTPGSSGTPQQQPPPATPVVRRAATPDPAAVAATTGVPSERTAPVIRSADDFDGAVAEALRNIQ